MKKIGIFLFFLIITIGIVLVSTTRPNDEHPQAKDGVLDVTGWKFDKDGILPLNGEWEFYRDRLIGPDQFEADERGWPIHSTIEVPNSWNAYVSETQNEGRGYGTYRLVVKLDEQDQILALKIPRIATAYKLWMNGELLAASGSVGSHASEAIPHYLPQVAYFTTTSGTIDIIVQVSNLIMSEEASGCP
ncbi:hypothetical protein [Marinicrinis lubricantis]|uniref:Glycosyl hydrolases family 2 sugar binding domain-containing protein n=1 Tax=Marinicrinis lubricantis TaxID=2086470 RepID=A0ABW1ITZ4_9BACL